MDQGRPDEARRPLEMACSAGLTDSCLMLGKLLTFQRDFQPAERALRQVHDEGNRAGYDALADLYDARQAPGDAERAKTQRYDALAIEHSAAEVAVALRLGADSAGGAVSLYIHPMAFFSRRLLFGGQVAFGPTTELNGLLGYQYFVTEWLVPYATLQMGGIVSPQDAERFNVGVEGGVKLSFPSLAHLSVGVGSSRGNPGYLSVGLGLNYLFVLFAALAH